jgi:hypothetical protein
VSSRTALSVSNASRISSSEAPRDATYSAEELEFVWDGDIWNPLRARTRETMPTLPDEDPLRYDLSYDPQRDATRDSMPTLPDVDPLRYDSEYPPAEERVEESYTLRRVAR